MLDNWAESNQLQTAVWGGGGGGHSQEFWLGVCRPHRYETNENWDPTEGPNLENETQIKGKKKIKN